jgi:hypothetical protein
MLALRLSAFYSSSPAATRTHPQPMNKLVIMAAAASLAAAPSSLANDSGRTVVVLRNRPVAINPVPRPVISHVRFERPSEEALFSARINPFYGYVPGRLSTRFLPALRVPAIYGTVNPRLHYISPIFPNGYVGGLANLPTSVVQIPPTFSRTFFHHGHHIGHHHHGHHGHFGGTGQRPGGNASPGGGRPANGGGRGR